MYASYLLYNYSPPPTSLFNVISLVSFSVTILWCTIILCIHTVPTAAPQSVSGSAIDSTSISLSWSPPPLPDQNGLIQYSISVHEVATGTLTQYTSTNSSIAIRSLHPYYTYRCSVAAYTIIGEGPQNQQPVIIKTLQDSKVQYTCMLATYSITI